MGELVLDVVERVIGREVDAEAHRDLIDEAVDARCGADTPVAARPPKPRRGSEPDPPGLRRRRHRGAPTRPTSVALAADLDAVEQLVLANAAAAGGPDRHGGAAAGPPGRPARPAGRQGLDRGPPPGRLRRLAVPRPEVPERRRLAGHRVRQAAEGQRIEEPALSQLQARHGSAATPPPSSRTCPTTELEEVEDELFRFARTVESTPGAAQPP